MEEIEQSREATRSTGAGDGMPHSDAMHNSINLVEAVANPSSQHVALALDPMESSSLNLENTEAAPKNAHKSKFYCDTGPENRKEGRLCNSN
ncbi:hypothetical protein ACOSQ4_012620 [Xanthoceras sorbifolium]